MQSLQTQHHQPHGLRQLCRLAACVYLLLAVLVPSHSYAAFLTESSDNIKAQLESIEAELAVLPQASPSVMPTTLGYRTKPMKSVDEQLIIDVRFRGPSPIDEVVLMPAGYSDDGSQYRAFGFPKRFLIERMLHDGSTDVLFDQRSTDYSIHGIEPQHFPSPDKQVTQGLRITVNRGSVGSPAERSQIIVAFAELFAFSGQQNVALNAEVETSQSKWLRNLWTSDYLVDGHFLFSPVIKQAPSLWSDFQAAGDAVILNYDLGSARTIDEFRLWPALLAHNYNTPAASGTSFPTQIKLERLESPDDSNPRLIYKNPIHTLRPGNTPMMQRLDPISGRYFRLTLKEGFPYYTDKQLTSIALGEVQLLENGEVISHGSQPKITAVNLRSRIRGDSARLSDGKTGAGQILPVRTWLTQFSRQQTLSREKAELEAELELALRQEKERTRVLIAATLALIIILALTIVVVRLLASRRWAKMREQIACDLHDEVGANLSSIAHTTELIKELITDPSAMQQELLEDAIQTARLTARDTRQFIQFLEQRDTGLQVDGHIQKIARQILGTIEHTITLNETRAFNQLVPIQQWDFFFFLKEALNNIIKHSGATHVEVSTLRKNRQIQLVVQDNGCGIPDERLPLHHLERRAKQLKGELTVATNSDNGTRITLTLKK